MPTSRPPLSAEVRSRLRDQILKRKPWLNSTGPRSPEGKAATSRNAWRHGFYSEEAIQVRRVITRFRGEGAPSRESPESQPPPPDGKGRRVLVVTENPWCLMVVTFVIVVVIFVVVVTFVIVVILAVVVVTFVVVVMDGWVVDLASDMDGHAPIKFGLAKFLGRDGPRVGLASARTARMSRDQDRSVRTRELELRCLNDRERSLRIGPEDVQGDASVGGLDELEVGIVCAELEDLSAVGAFRVSVVTLFTFRTMIMAVVAIPSSTGEEERQGKGDGIDGVLHDCCMPPRAAFGVSSEE